MQISGPPDVMSGGPLLPVEEAQTILTDEGPSTPNPMGPISSTVSIKTNDIFDNVPYGMYTDDEGVLRRNLPTTVPTEIQESGVQASSTLTLNGFSFPECKSAMQKAVRRGRPDEAIQWVYQMFNTPLKNTAAKTNTINRLLVCALEDIGPAQPWAILATIATLQPVWSNEDPGAAHMAALKCAAFLASPTLQRTRAADLLCCVSTKLITPTVGPKFADITIKEKYGGDLEVVKDRLVDAIKAKNIEQMVYLSDLLFFTTIKVDGKARNRRTKGHYLVMEAYKEAIPDNMYIETVTSLHVRLTKSSRLIYSNIALLHLNNKFPEGNWPSYLTKEGSSGLFHLSFDEMVIATLNSVQTDAGTKYGIPEYALDKHTAIGSKTLKRGLKHFLKEGRDSPTYIHNESEGLWSKTSTYLMGLVKKGHKI